VAAAVVLQPTFPAFADEEDEEQEAYDNPKYPPVQKRKAA
jgi:hypothetical protein